MVVNLKLRLYVCAGFWGAGSQSLFTISDLQRFCLPLKEHEEFDLITRLDQGDMAVKAKLIEHNLRLVVYIAKKFENTGINIEDLVSIGTIGLIKAVNTFEPKKNIKLATYGSRCIENEILMYLRRNLKNKVEVSLDEPLNVDWDGNELLLSDVLGTESDMIYKKIESDVEKHLLWQAMHKLNPRERIIIKLRFGLEDGLEKTQRKLLILWEYLSHIYPVWKSVS